MKNLALKNCVELTMPCGQKIKFDESDYWIIKKFSSIRKRGGYATVTRYIKTEFGAAKEEYYLHRLIMKMINPKFSELRFEIDHINRDKFDNRKCNLRFTNRSLNNRNRGKKYGTKSKFYGVSLVSKLPKTKDGKKWRAYLKTAKKQLSLGYFKTEIEAANAYNVKAFEIYGEYAPLNDLTNI